MTAKLVLEYNGTAYAGWARQPDRASIQECVEKSLARIRREPTVLTVAGRTDAGVHARGQVASHGGEPVPAYAINAALPPDIRVLASEAAAPSFNARHDALSRTYRYRVFNRSVMSPFEAGFALHERRALDAGGIGAVPPALAACAAALRGSHDFTAFTPTDTRHTRFSRRVMRAEWVRESEHVLDFWIEADSFMRHMVRVLVGSMLAVAKGRYDVPWFEGLLDGAPRSAAAETAPAHGLYLEAVRYPPEASR